MTKLCCTWTTWHNSHIWLLLIAWDTVDTHTKSICMLKMYIYPNGDIHIPSRPSRLVLFYSICWTTYKIISNCYVLKVVAYRKKKLTIKVSITYISCTSKSITYISSTSDISLSIQFYKGLVQKATPFCIIYSDQTPVIAKYTCETVGLHIRLVQSKFESFILDHPHIRSCKATVRVDHTLLQAIEHSTIVRASLYNLKNWRIQHLKTCIDSKFCLHP